MSTEPRTRPGLSGRTPGQGGPLGGRRVIAALVTAVGLVLMFLLALSTNNRTLYEENYARLFGINVVVAVLLSLVLAWVIFRLLRRLRQGKFGSRLLIKLAAIFALVGVVPGVLVYFVSYQFVVALDRELVRRQGRGRT